MKSEKHILMVASNSAVSPVTGWPIGFWWAELTHALKVFEDAGHLVTIASPLGGDLQGDGLSDPEDESGYSADDTVTLAFQRDPSQMARLRGTPKVAEIDSIDVDAVFVVGGQGPMVTMIDDGDLHRFVADVYETGGIVAAVCHGTCILLKTRLQDGELLVHGKRWTGFADKEEDYVESAMGRKIQPFRIETEASRIPGTEFVTAGMFEPFAVRDGRLITGQQQASSARAAEEVVAALG